MQYQGATALLTSIYTYIPIATPAVNIHTCSPDRELLQVRVSLLGAATLTAFAASFAVGITLFSPALVISVIAVPAFYAILIQDLALAEIASDKQAVLEYIQKDTPSSHSIRRIIRSVTCAKQLINYTKDISKISEAKTRILDPTHLKKEIFELFVESSVDVLIKDENGIPLIVDFEDPSFLDYALKKNRLLSTQLTPAEQISCFQHVRNIESISVLKNAGFSVNICDENGFTPLLKCIFYAEGSLENKNRAGTSYYKIIEALLAHGADPYIGMIYRGKQCNAVQFNRNPAIAILLKNYLTDGKSYT